MIKHLLRNELFSQKTYVYFFIIPWIILITNFFTSGDPFRHVLLLMMLALWLPINAPYYEHPALVNSLPVTRKKIVTAKYLSPLACFIPAAVLTFFYVFLFVNFAQFPARLMTGWDLLLALAGLYLLMSIFYVLYITHGFYPALIVTVVVSLAASIGLQMIMNIYHNPDMTSFDKTVETVMTNQNIFIVLFAGISLIFTLLSYAISVRLYARKDF